jgi:fructose-bisphosphate aldolase, class I
VLRTVFARLTDHRVALDGMLLKTGMVLPGDTCPDVATLEQVAEATLHVLRADVPRTVPGIVFLSGGQNDVKATERLNAICSHHDHPWRLSFSFGRALQQAALKTWAGDVANVAAAQAALLQRARLNALAVQGRYPVGSEQVLA